jgi:hypothetical protein
MIGFDSIGQGSIGELAGDANDLLIFAPAAVAVTVTVAAPVIIGITIFAPVAKAVTVTLGSAPVVTAGKSVSPPAAAVGVTKAVPGISISFNLRPPQQTVAVVAVPPSILGGNYIEASNTITMTTPYGEIGSSSIAEFAIGEGEPSSRIVRRGPLVVVTSASPLVSAGKSTVVPAAAVSITSPRAEIDSRRRKLRVFAIAS